MYALFSGLSQACFGATHEPQPLGSKNYTPVIAQQPRITNDTQNMRAANTQQLLNAENKPAMPVLALHELEATCCELAQLIAYDYWSWLCPTTPRDIEQLHQQHIAPLLENCKTIAEFVQAMNPIVIAQFHQSKEFIDSSSEFFIRLVNLSQQFMQKIELHPACKGFSNEDKYRALTNYWAYILFAHCCDEKITTIPEDIFAVSLLYPLTDDLLDTPDLDNDIKKKICAIITEALKPETDSTQLKASLDLTDDELNIKLQHIIDLISTVKKFHSAEENCGAFASLQVMHHLQMQSDKIQRSTVDLRDIFAITAGKGAGSVMIDAYLQKHQLTEQQQALAVLIGTLAQLWNDIKGIEEDTKAKITTPATRYFAVDGNIDSLVRGILFIVERAKQQLPNDQEKTGIHKNNTLMALDLFTVELLSSALQGVGTKECKLSADFVRMLEHYSQLPAPFMAALKTLEVQLYQQGTLTAEQQMTSLKRIIASTQEQLHARLKSE